MTEDVEQVFEYGQCHALALALHARTGWPIVSLFSRKLGDASHYLVRRPDGQLVDVRGTRTEREVLDQWDDGYAGFYEVREYGASQLWAEVHRGDMEDPADVWPLARQTAAQLAGEQPAVVSAAAPVQACGNAFDSLLLQLQAETSSPASQAELLRSTADRLVSYAAAQLTQATNLERAAAVYDERGLGDLATSVRNEARLIRVDADRDEAQARALTDVAAELART